MKFAELDHALAAHGTARSAG